MFVFSVLCPPEEGGCGRGQGSLKICDFLGGAKSIMVNVGPGCVKITPKNPFVSSPSDPFFLEFFLFFPPLSPPLWCRLVFWAWLFFLCFGVLGFFFTWFAVVVGIV